MLVRLSGVGLLRGYYRQAEHYDETCSASPSVLRPVLEALAGAPGRRLADIGGGTGNYALALEDAGPSRLGLVHCKRVGWPGPRHRLRVNRAVEFESGAASSPARE